MTARVALATCTDVHGLARDDRLLVPTLKDLGITAEPAVWDDPKVDWDAYDLTVVRSTWDNMQRSEEFLDWADTVPRLENPAPAIRWNTDRRYLLELDKAGVPVIDTIWLDPGAHLSKRAVHSRMPAFGDFVVKPVISAGPREVGRYQPVSAQSRSKAIEHTMRLLDSGRWVMIQPYVTSIDTHGEVCLTFINDEFQHAVRRKALLGGPHRKTVGLALYSNESMTSVSVTAEQLDVARRALAEAHRLSGVTKPFLYARVDLVTGEPSSSTKDLRLVTKEGPMVIEIEVVDPSLTMRHSGGNPTAANFAAAIASRIGTATRPSLRA